MITEKLILDAVKLSLDAYKKDEIVNTLNKIESKLDQMISREIKSSYDAISDALVTNNEITKSKRLDFAEDNLLKNTNLDPALKTGNIENIHLIALAHYGLAFVCTLRGDSAIAARHLLHIYEIAPSIARKELVPLIYENVLKDECSSIFGWYKEREREIGSDKFKLRTSIKKVGAVSIGVVGTALGVVPFLVGKTSIVYSSIEKAKTVWSDATPEEYRKSAQEDLRDELDKKLDNRCQEVAKELLNSTE